MCLEYVVAPKRKSGLGWKAVRETKEPGVYKGQWSYMNECGGGSTMFGHHTQETYHIGKKTVPGIKVTVEDPTDHVRYQSGIHVYLYKKEAIKEVEYRPSHNLHLMRVRYSGAYASDDKVVVVEAVIPIRID